MGQPVHQPAWLSISLWFPRVVGRVRKLEEGQGVAIETGGTVDYLTAALVHNLQKSKSFCMRPPNLAMDCNIYWRLRRGHKRQN
jgi:hypothetical protein